MAYDEILATRLQTHFVNRPDVEVKKMFGGLCFMVSNHMCCGIVGDTLMARVGPDNYDDCMQDKYAREMDFTGKTMKGMVYVSREGIKNDIDLHRWVSICESFVKTLPPKKRKLKQRKNRKKAKETKWAKEIDERNERNEKNDRNERNKKRKRRQKKGHSK